MGASPEEFGNFGRLRSMPLSLVIHVQCACCFLHLYIARIHQCTVQLITQPGSFQDFVVVLFTFFTFLGSQPMEKLFLAFPLFNGKFGNTLHLFKTLAEVKDHGSLSLRLSLKHVSLYRYSYKYWPLLRFCEANNNKF